MTAPNSTVSDERLAEIANFQPLDWGVTHTELTGMARELQSLRSLSTGTDAGVRVTVAEALRQLSSAIEADDRDQARRNEMLATLIVNIEKAEPTAELAAALRDFVREERQKLSALEQQPAASQEGDGTGVVGECRYCANTGWFYGDPDLGTYCGCDFGKLRETLSAPTSKGEVSEEMVERALDAAQANAAEHNEWVSRQAMRAALTAALTGKGA